MILLPEDPFIAFAMYFMKFSIASSASGVSDADDFFFEDFDTDLPPDDLPDDRLPELLLPDDLLPDLLPDLLEEPPVLAPLIKSFAVSFVHVPS